MTVTLRAALDAEKRTRDALTFVEWGRRLTLPQYLEREQRLRDHPWARRGMVTWLLLEDQTVLASCETFRTDSTVGTTEGCSFAVATVFTEPHLRRRGHASALMGQLVARLRLETGAQSSVLFSDVGAPLYEQSGFRALPAGDWVLPSVESAPPARLRWFDSAVAPPKSFGGPGELVLQPSVEQLDWHFERSRYYARVLRRPAVPHCGARTDEAAIWWTAHYKADELLVLRLQAPDADAARPLVEAAQAQAYQAGLKRVRLWETVSLAAIPFATRVSRKGELPMFASLGPALSHWRQIERALWV